MVQFDTELWGQQLRIPLPAVIVHRVGFWDEGGKNGLANSGGLRHDTTSFKESFHGHAPPPVHS